MVNSSTEDKGSWPVMMHRLLKEAGDGSGREVFGPSAPQVPQHPGDRQFE